MSEEKPSATIIKGPWKKRSKGPTEEELIIVDQLAMTDEIVNECSMAYLELLIRQLHNAASRYIKKSAQAVME